MNQLTSARAIGKGDYFGGQAARRPATALRGSWRTLLLDPACAAIVDLIDWL